MEAYLLQNGDLEIKKEYTDSLLKTLSAFSNFEGGRILIGIDDDKNIIGVNNYGELKLVINKKIIDNIFPYPNYQINILEINNKNIIEIKVFPGENTPYLYNGDAYQRIDSNTVPADQISLIKLFLKGKNITFDQMISKNNNFNFNILENYFKNKKKLGLIKTY